MTACVDRFVILLQVLLVLPVDPAGLRNGGVAEPVDVCSGPGGVALEVSLQRVVLLGKGEFISRLRKVVHADVNVPAGGQLLYAQLQQPELRLRAWKKFGLE